MQRSFTNSLNLCQIRASEQQHYNNNLGTLIFFKLYWTNLFKRH